MRSKLLEGNAEQRVLMNQREELLQEQARLEEERETYQAMVAENERLRIQQDELREQLIDTKAKRDESRRELRRAEKEKGVHILEVCVCKDFHIPEKSSRRQTPYRVETDITPAADFTAGQRVARICIPVDWTLQYFCELIRDGFLTEKESIERRKAQDAAPYEGDSLFTQRGLRDPSRR